MSTCFCVLYTCKLHSVVTRVRRGFSEIDTPCCVPATKRVLQTPVNYCVILVCFRPISAVFFNGWLNRNCHYAILGKIVHEINSRDRGVRQGAVDCIRAVWSLDYHPYDSDLRSQEPFVLVNKAAPFVISLPSNFEKKAAHSHLRCIF